MRFSFHRCSQHTAYRSLSCLQSLRSTQAHVPFFASTRRRGNQNLTPVPLHMPQALPWTLRAPSVSTRASETSQALLIGTTWTKTTVCSMPIVSSDAHPARPVTSQAAQRACDAHRSVRPKSRAEDTAKYLKAWTDGICCLSYSYPTIDSGFAMASQACASRLPAVASSRASNESKLGVLARIWRPGVALLRRDPAKHPSSAD